MINDIRDALTLIPISGIGDNFVGVDVAAKILVGLFEPVAQMLPVFCCWCRCVVGLGGRVSQ